MFRSGWGGGGQRKIVNFEYLTLSLVAVKKCKRSDPEGILSKKLLSAPEPENEENPGKTSPNLPATPSPFSCLG